MILDSGLLFWAALYIQLQCQLITYFCISNTSQCEPKPNWSTVGLRDYKNDWPWGPVTTAAGPTTTNRDPPGTDQPRVYFSSTSNFPL